VFIKKMLADKRFWKSVLMLALPIALQNLLTSSFSLIDILMIGSLSDNAISAVGMAAQITFLHNVFLFGICSGGSIFVAQYWGAGNISGIKKTYGVILANCFTVSLVFFTLAFFMPELCMRVFTDNDAVTEIGVKYLRYVAFSYFGVSLTMGFSSVLRATEQVKIPLYSNIFSVATNILFNYLLIFGKFGFPQMGVTGAALATVIASVVNPTMVFLFSAAKRTIIFSSIKELFSFTVSGLREFYSIVLPVFFNEMLWAVGMTAYNSIYGHMSHSHFAALTISKTVENLVFVFFIGLCNACAVLVGKYIGLKRFEDAKEYAKRFLCLVPVTGLLLGAAVIGLRGSILSLFNIEDNVRQVASLLLLVFGLAISVKNIPFIAIVGIFRAGGDPKKGMLFDLLCLWGIGLPITFVCGILLKMDFVLVYILMILSEDVTKTILCIKYFLTMKWIRPVKQ